MKRRSFIRNIAFSTPAAFSVPFILSSCKKDDTDPVDYEGKVTIIGAGAAGLYAAHLLNERGITVEILEASGTYGGRVRPLKNFADCNIELGAEEIHGKNSVLYEMARDDNSTISYLSTDDYIMLDDVLKVNSEAEKDSDFKAAVEFVENAANYSNSTERTVKEHMLNEGINARVQHYVNALLGNEYGTDISRISINGLVEEENLWSSGDKNYIITNKNILVLFEHRLSKILDKITYNTPISSVNYSKDPIKLIDAAGTSHNADKVICTVPLSILKNGDIAFSPSLPSSKTNAMTNLGMDTGIKIIMKFKDRFWDQDLGSLYGSGYAPEIWFTSKGRGGSDKVLTAFIMGEKAEYLSSLGDNAVDTVISELNSMYGGTTASDALVDSYLIDWSKETYIKGAYSYPLKSGSIEARKQLASSLGNKLFFAGEATHYAGHAATLHGAMETAQRAVDELIETIG